MENIRKINWVLVCAAVVMAMLAVGGDMARSQAQEQSQPATGNMARLQRIAGTLGGPAATFSGVTVRGVAYVRVGDIKGDVTDRTHYEWVRAIGVDYEIRRPETKEGGRLAGKCEFSEVSIVKEVDKATPALAVACASGKKIPEVEFNFTQETAGRRVVYFRMALKNALIVAVGPLMVQQSGGQFIHLEQVSFNYDEIEWEYTPFDEKGKASAPVRAGWSVSRNKAL